MARDIDIFDARICNLGEGPLWHPLREQLFWIDIPNQKLLSAASQEQREHVFDEMISALGWIDRDTLLLASESGLYRLAIADWRRDLICPLEADVPGNRSNDGRADPWGGFWIGTMGKKAEAAAGAFYRFYKGELRCLLPNITVTNGLCFDQARALAYCTDSATKKTWRLRLDGEGWPIAEPELFLDLTAQGLTVDGAVTDGDGFLWCAIFDGGAVIRISPDGDITDRFAIQTPRATCPAFGGTDYRDLFVTTAAIGLDAADGGGVPHGVTLRLPGVGAGKAEPRVILEDRA